MNRTGLSTLPFPAQVHGLASLQLFSIGAGAGAKNPTRFNPQTMTINASPLSPVRLDAGGADRELEDEVVRFAAGSSASYL